MHTIKVPIYDDAGRPEYVLGLAEDVTEQKQTEQDLIRAKEKAEDMARLKDAFLTNMSHEIRTPLTSIIGFSEILADDYGGEGADIARMINKAGQRLLDTLNSVLDLAQLESRTLQLRLESVDLNEVVLETLDLFGHRAAELGLSLAFDRPPRPIHAVLDRGALGRILNNLVSNALKFTREGGVTIRTGDGEEGAWIQVEDTGVGINPEFLPHLFDEFQQESYGLSRSFEGSGLGLTITKRLVDMMGGEISVESEKGKGSVFTVRFRQTIQENAPEQEAESPARKESTPEPDASGIRILAVEDTPENQRLLEHVLGSQFQFETASTFDEAIEKAATETFDLLIIDINLGESRSGIDILNTLRAREEYRDVPMIACTAYGLPTDGDRLLAAGFDGYISKPFTRKRIIETVSGFAASLA